MSLIYLNLEIFFFLKFHLLDELNSERLNLWDFFSSFTSQWMGLINETKRGIKMMNKSTNENEQKK